MDLPTYEEFAAFIKNQKGNSAPGPSRFRYSLLIHATQPIWEAMHIITCICLLLDGVPRQFKFANLFPIPKSSGLLI